MCSHYFFLILFVTPQCDVEIEKKKSNVNTLILLLDQVFFSSIFADVTVGDVTVDQVFWKYRSIFLFLIQSYFGFFWTFLGPLGLFWGLR